MLSPTVDNTSNTPSPNSRIDTSNVPPPKSYTRIVCPSSFSRPYDNAAAVVVNGDVYEGASTNTGE